MKKKNILSLTVLSSLMAIAGFSSFNRVSADSVGVHAAETTSTTMPTGWEASGVTAENTISPFKDSVQGNSILLKRTVAEGVLKARSTLTTVKPNTYYNFSVNAKTTGASQLKIRVVEYKDGTSALKATEVIKVTTVTGDWVSRPGMLKTTAETNGVVIEIEATGTGEVYASKLFVHEGVAPTGVMTGRTKYFEGTKEAPDLGLRNEDFKDLTSDMLSTEAITGYSSLKLAPGKGIYLKFDDYKITGKYVIRFKYRFKNGGDTNARLGVRLDGVDPSKITVDNPNGRIYEGPAPSSGGNKYDLWKSYSYEFAAKAGVAEPIFVAIYAAWQDTSKDSNSYYLIDDVEVIDEKGNSLIENGDFELKEASTVNTMGYVEFSGTDANWGSAKFTNIPLSAYINDGVNKTRAIRLGAKKALGISLPILPEGQYKLSFNYRTNGETSMPIRMDGFALDGNQFWFPPISISNSAGKWASAEYSFKTYGKNSEGADIKADVQYMVFNANTQVDLDNISVKDAAGNEFLYGGDFDPIMAGGASYLNNTGAYLSSSGDVVYSAMKKIATAADERESYITVSPYSLGIDTTKSDVPYTLSFEYLGGSENNNATVSTRTDWISDGTARAMTWTKKVAPFTTKVWEGDCPQELRIYGNHYAINNCYIRNISVKDVDGNEYFHPFANGASILPQGSFRDEAAEDKKAVDEFVAVYITGQAAEDYTAIPEADRAGKCQNKLKAAEGAYKRLTQSQKDLFNNSPDYEAARAAMDMWRTVSSKTSIGIFGGNAASNSTTILVCTLLAISAVAITSFVLIRKKKHN